MKMKFGIVFVFLLILFGGYLCFHQKNNTTDQVGDHTFVTWKDHSISVSGLGLSHDDTTVTILSGGTYEFTGTTSNGNIIVDAKNDEVTILLNSLHLTSKLSAPIYVKKAKKVNLVIQDHTENELIDVSTYENTDGDEINAVIHSKSDFNILGKGTLNIQANYNNGITGKDSVTIQDSIIHIKSNNNGIRAKDSLKIKNSNIQIEALGNGIQVYNESSGSLELVDSEIDINAAQDGIEAISSLTIQDGNYQITTGGGSKNTSTKNDWGSWGEGTESTSAKGIKSDQNIVIQSGTISIDSSDDAIHCNNTITIKSGAISISSGDDGIHADHTLSIENGTIDIDQSYEGLEATNIRLTGGTVHIKSTDDGINAAGGSDGSSLDRRGENMFTSDGSKIIISGGYYVIDASGDGIDSNGDIEMTDGTVIVLGPTDQGNGALDYNGTYLMNGGTLIAVGSSGMAEAPSTNSTQNSIKVSFSEQSSDSTIQITDGNQKPILTFSPSKTYSSLVYSSPSLVQNETYTIQLGGSATGENKDGIFENVTSYQNGTTLTTLTLSNRITTYGDFKMMGGKMDMPPKR